MAMYRIQRGPFNEKEEKAWRRIHGELECSHCNHSINRHIMGALPYIFHRKAEPSDYEAGMDIYTYEHSVGDDYVEYALVREYASHTLDLFMSSCLDCAETMNTSQVICFRRSFGIGEIIGIPELVGKLVNE